MTGRCCESSRRPDRTQPLIVVIVALESELARRPLPAEAQLIHSGVGKINAALAARDAIDRFRPRLVVNYGTAGAVHSGAHGLLRVSSVIQRDMDAEPLAPRGTTPFGSVPTLIESGEPGICCATGDSFVRAPDGWLKAQGADVVDMELFAIAETCRRAGVLWWACKYVTDSADESAADHWNARVGEGEALFLAALEERLANTKL
jgi:adenosylhomocysteine nucleosidase